MLITNGLKAQLIKALCSVFLLGGEGRRVDGDGPIIALALGDLVTLIDHPEIREREEQLQNISKQHSWDDKLTFPNS
jgi:hypothetical protein